MKVINWKINTTDQKKYVKNVLKGSIFRKKSWLKPNIYLVLYSGIPEMK